MNVVSNERNKLIAPPSSRWEWVERDFTEKEVCDEDYVSWIWKHVRIGPFSKKLNLRDGEVVRTTPLHNGGMKVEIRFENNKVAGCEPATHTQRTD